jgi:AraC family transcriptional regulator of adaptative response/methylated-DNA-[protein]-cysteine methyltransferase
MHPKTSSLRFAIGSSSLGVFAVVASDKGVAAILFGASRPDILADLRRRFEVLPQEDAKGLATLLQQAAAMIADPRRAGVFTLAPQGTKFQRQVWHALRQIPAGCTASYGDVARRIGSPRAVRAVAQACAANPIAIAIPCHRVVRSDGAAGGYRWGAKRKAMLLAAEAAL